MHILVIGAGASIEEAQRGSVPYEFWPPTISNFAEKMWDGTHNKFFVYWLPDYLLSCGFEPGNDPTSEFIRLEKLADNSINVERLFEYCWEHREEKHSGAWEDLITHGVLGSLTFLLSQGFFENGHGIKQLTAAKLVSSRLNDGDVILNLNYDTLFEIGAEQAGVTLTFVPNHFLGKGVMVAKPHGSFNLLANEESFWFAQPDSIGALPSSDDNFRSFRSIIPPRFNKSYAQQPIAKIIFDGVSEHRPDILTFWGVGLTDSDVDLIDIYKKWLGSSSIVEVINPDPSVAEKIKNIVDRDIKYFATLDEWLSVAS